MIGYIARDENKSLWFHYVKPHRQKACELGYWESDERVFQVYDSDFPEFKELKWQDNPARVGFQIHKTNIQD